MSFNNSVQDARGRTVGFRCFECGDVFQSMWGEVCNGCRRKEERHQELLAAIRSGSMGPSLTGQTHRPFSTGSHSALCATASEDLKP